MQNDRKMILASNLVPWVRLLNQAGWGFPASHVRPSIMYDTIWHRSSYQERQTPPQKRCLKVHPCESAVTVLLSQSAYRWWNWRRGNKCPERPGLKQV